LPICARRFAEKGWVRYITGINTLDEARWCPFVGTRAPVLLQQSSSLMHSKYQSGSKTADGIPYTVQLSARAKYPRLKMLPHEGLVVVIPSGYDRKRLPDLLLQYREWIRTASEKIEGHRLQPEQAGASVLPVEAVFHYHGERWEIAYREGGLGVAEAFERSGNVVEVCGDIANPSLCRAVLRLWVKNKAHRELIPKLRGLADLHGLSYTRAGVRLQRSRWGSCTSAGTITLNTKLLFLPPHLVHSVMVHELCHTIQMNHSRLFWKQVETIDAAYRTHDSEMKSAWKYVPAWAARSDA